MQVTGKKNGGGDAGEFLPEDFRDGEYEAAVTLEKQEDLKTLPAHFVSLGEQQWKIEKEREAEVRTVHEIHQRELGGGGARQEGEERDKVNATIPMTFLYQIRTDKEATSMGEAVGNNSLARL